METYKVKVMMPDRKRSLYKTVLANGIEIAATLIIKFIYNEICNDERSSRIPKYIHQVNILSESEKEVELNLFISRMDMGKEFDINIHLKRITKKNEMYEGIILSQKIYKCNVFCKDEKIFINV